MPSFSVNTDKLVALANKIDKLHKSALPVAIRQTLNDAAFATKDKFLMNEFDKQFVIRKRNFIKSHSSVNKTANTFNVNQMRSEVGVIKGKSKAGDELRFQEYGGTVKNRDYIPTDMARASGSHSKLVSKNHYLKNIKKKKSKPQFKNQDFIKSVFKAGEGGHVIYDYILFEVKKIVKKTNRLFFKLKPIYSYRKGRSVTITKKPFLSPASTSAIKTMPEIFVKNAQRQINKYI